MDASTHMMSEIVGFIAGFTIFGAIVGYVLKYAFDKYSETMHENEQLKAEVITKQFEQLTNQIATMGETFQSSVEKLESIIAKTANKVAEVQMKVAIIQHTMHTNKTGKEDGNGYDKGDDKCG